MLHISLYSIDHDYLICDLIKAVYFPHFWRMCQHFKQDDVEL